MLEFSETRNLLHMKDVHFLPLVEPVGVLKILSMESFPLLFLACRRRSANILQSIPPYHPLFPC